MQRRYRGKGRKSRLQRFWEKVDHRGPDDCWSWNATTNGNGYGKFGLGTKDEGEVYAHRFSYELANGAIPDGLEIDHLCRNRACVNPTHLEAVTRAENMRRYAGSKTHCIHGHPLTEDNVYIQPNRGTRSCRTCRREVMARSRRGETQVA